MLLVLELNLQNVRPRLDGRSFSEPPEPVRVLDRGQMVSSAGQGMDVTVAPEAASKFFSNFDFLPLASKHEPDLLSLCISNLLLLGMGKTYVHQESYSFLVSY